MKLLFDQNISPKILKLLPKKLSNCQQVRFVGLENVSDFEIFQYARTNSYAIVTFDSDFVDLNALYGTPPKIIWLNTGNLTTQNVSQLVLRSIGAISEYLESKTDDILEINKAK